jgi:hypothetical protein
LQALNNDSNNPYFAGFMTAMSKIAFECMDASNNTFTVKMESDSQEIEQVVAATVQAYKREGIEVISATRTEELVVDVNLYTPAERRAHVSNAALQSLAGRGGVWLQRGAALGALVLSVIGFDADLSFVTRVAHMSSAVMHTLQLAV